jgi:hypothetical protein
MRDPRHGVRDTLRLFREFLKWSCSGGSYGGEMYETCQEKIGEE